MTPKELIQSQSKEPALPMSPGSMPLSKRPAKMTEPVEKTVMSSCTIPRGSEALRTLMTMYMPMLAMTSTMMPKAKVSPKESAQPEQPAP